MYYILGFTIFVGLTYYFRNTIIYHFILYYDKLVSFKQKKITCTGINNKEMIEFNYWNYNDYFNYDIILVNFTINNKYKRLISSSICDSTPTNIDFSKLNYIPHYNSPIIFASVDLNDTTVDSAATANTANTANLLNINAIVANDNAVANANDNAVANANDNAVANANDNANSVKDLDITSELNEFILHDCNVNLNNNKLNKLMWISIINKKYSTNYSKNVDITYNIILQDVTNWKQNNINIVVNNGIMSVN
jgi:hypothetical protein